MGGLQFSDQFLQFSAKLSTANVYGFGETEHHSLKHDMNWRRWTMWARDEPIKVRVLKPTLPKSAIFDDLL